MKSYNLNIAGYSIRVEAGDDGTDLEPSARFLRNIVQDNDPDVLITVHRSTYSLPEAAGRVFHAPLFEEINGFTEKISDNFWSIHKFRSDLFIKTTFPLCPTEKSGILEFSLTGRNWNLYLNYQGDTTDPLDYPLDSLILYYLTVINSDIMVHASGINHFGQGFLFSGTSGKGKTTMAKLWDKAGAKVIHDDRLIIRKGNQGITMYNTPVYSNENPSEAPLKKIFLIEHGDRNVITPVSGASAVSLFLSNCIQHNWNPEIIARLMGAVSIMCSVIPVFRLSFRPDRSVIDFILDHE
jgi:hypothetical protein